MLLCFASSYISSMRGIIVLRQHAIANIIHSATILLTFGFASFSNGVMAMTSDCDTAARACLSSSPPGADQGLAYYNILLNCQTSSLKRVEIPIINDALTACNNIRLNSEHVYMTYRGNGN